MESMDDYKDEIEKSLKKIKAGDVMQATVVSVDEEAATVDLDYYAPGKIYAADFSEAPDFNIMKDVEAGGSFKAIVKQTDDGSGNIILSKVDADKEFSWEKLSKMMEDKSVITGKIADVSNAGAVMYVEGIRGFIPASKLDIKYVEDTAPYLGKQTNVIIADIDEEKGRLILSAKELLTEAAIENQKESIGKLEVGSVVEGVVESIKDYGAFIDIGDGLSGLLHISEISNKRIKHPKAVLKEGQNVSVMISKIEDGKISLSMKAIEQAEEQKIEDEAREYKSEYVPNNPFAELLKDIKLD